MLHLSLLPSSEQYLETSQKVSAGQPEHRRAISGVCCSLATKVIEQEWLTSKAAQKSLPGGDLEVTNSSVEG